MELPEDLIAPSCDQSQYSGSQITSWVDSEAAVGSETAPDGNEKKSQVQRYQ